MKKYLIVGDPCGSHTFQMIHKGYDPSALYVWEDSIKGQTCIKYYSQGKATITDNLEEFNGMKFTCAIGNPPYGNAGRKAVDFLNKLSELTDRIHIIMPRSIRKASLINSLNPHLHLVKDVTNEDKLFGRIIKTVTQTYHVKNELRPKIELPKTHPDFIFSYKGNPNVNVFVMRSGARSGKTLTSDFSDYEESHYFLIAKNDQVIDNLIAISDKLMQIAQETTGMPKLSKGELVSTYVEHYDQ